MREKILLDTDIGSDIDDAICLAYLLAQPRDELLGINTVSGQPVERAQLASALCIAFGSSGIPIFPGIESPQRDPQRQPLAQQASVLPRWDHQRDFQTGRAVGFMADTIRKHPGEVTLLAIGPQTNIARLFTEHPDIPPLLKRLMLMAGRFGPTPRGAKFDDEWNILCDPHAAEVVYQTPVARHSSVGLDVTMQVQMDAAEVRKRFSSGPLRVVHDMAEVWFDTRDVITFHDPLAAVCLFEPDVCGFVRGNVNIAASVQTRANTRMTRWLPASSGPHEVAMTVNPGAFFEQYFGVF